MHSLITDPLPLLCIPLHLRCTQRGAGLCESEETGH